MSPAVNEAGVAASAYDRAALALQLALERVNQAADRVGRAFASGPEPDETEIMGYRRLSAAFKYAEAVWQVEADRVISAGMRELVAGSAGTVPGASLR